ncbi:hypothetical protein ACVDG5_030690 [Mesorhizobium sp. ORM6]
MAQGHAGQLVALFPVRHTIAESYCLQKKPGNRSSAGIKRFREWLLAEIATHKQVMGGLTA